MDSPLVLLDFERVWPSLPYILAGIPVTLSYTGVSLVLGFIWGVCLAFFKEGPFSILKWVGRFYTSLFRGTPLLLQLTLIYYATPQITGYDIATWQAVILAFTLNSGAYVSESIRGGIQSVDKGQTEAALSLGLSYGATMKDIILPQAIRNILPSLVNESIDLLKESALVSVIGGADILRRANRLLSKPSMMEGFLGKIDRATGVYPIYMRIARKILTRKSPSRRSFERSLILLRVKSICFFNLY